ncbi:hypothetical protein [Aminobacter sp. MDW-2]|uniref:hypothetical protein n=1 Tax=Aminobacter sp. MDW-2 TaxID=2666139 RepID=UPI0012AF4F24|nr:hypothetical protein [Aminobacter sp. MDW-2]MRX32788.1 hypothetical protein [Aminobacter sp. MDW-2]QNH34550.1 hypothetical protein H5P29_00935 [Aminobacter sp. MDW-2]
MNRDEDMAIVPPTDLPRPSRLTIGCPYCGASIEYEPAEDDAGAFHAMEDWPVCEPCQIVIDVPPVSICRVEAIYYALTNL